MNWVILMFFSIIGISVIAIVITLSSLVKLGDERKDLIKMKAQSYSFVIIVFVLLIDIIQNIFVMFSGQGKFEDVDPFIFLTVISVIYLVSLLFFKKKYGG